MIKNLIPELENILIEGFAESSASLRRLLDSVGLGYVDDGKEIRLKEQLEILDPETILSHVNHAAPTHTSPADVPSSLQLEIHRSVGSTNDVVQSGLTTPQTMICLAEMQTAGKGRRGRNWVSPFGRNIYLTIGRHLKGPISALEGLSLVIGMQVVDVLRELGLADVGLKWPNDILLDGGKLGGILVELKPPSSHGIGVVMGIGINLMLDDRDAEAIDQPWSAASSKSEISRNQLAGLLIAKLLAATERFDETGFLPFASAWNEYNLFADQPIRIIRGNEEFAGLDRGVDEVGNLLLETATGLETHNSGEVSMRPVPQQ